MNPKQFYVVNDGGEDDDDGEHEPRPFWAVGYCPWGGRVEKSGEGGKVWIVELFFAGRT